MKKTLVWLLCFTCLFLFSGCGKRQIVSGNPENQDYKGDLSVYVIDTSGRESEESFYLGAINQFQNQFPEVNLKVTSFTNGKIMDQRVLTELSGGKGPDVVLMESDDNSIDLFKAASNDYFYDITNYVEIEKTRHTYYNGAFAGGILLGRQYILPFSARAVQLYTSEEKAEAYFPNLNEIYSVEELLNSILEVSKLLEQKDDVLAVLYNHYSESETNFMDWVHGTGIEFIDTQNKEVSVSKQQLRILAEFVKNTMDDSQKQSALNRLHLLSADDAYITHGVTSLFYGPMFDTYADFDYRTTQHGEKLKLIRIPNFDDNSKHSMMIVNHYGVINANTKNPDAAWGLLQRCLNYTPLLYEDKSLIYVSLSADMNRAVFKSLLWEKNPDDSHYFSIHSADKVSEFLQSTSNWQLLNKAVDKIVNQSFIPYFSGAATFDTCYDDLTSRLKIYIDE